jgi:phosphoribosylformylglycinamidine synthase PurS subunit
MTETEAPSTYAIDVRVSLRPAVLDTQGKAILRGLRAMGYGSIAEIHAGKYFRLAVAAPTREDALLQARSACERLLSNPVIETFTLDVVDGPST